MTPAVLTAQKAAIPHRIHEYRHDPGSDSWGTEAADKLGIAPERVFKTLVAAIDNRELVVAVVPVSAMLSMKQLARAAAGKKAAMADKARVQRSTGYLLGGVSPLGQKTPLRTFIDASARDFDTVHVSGGRRGLEIELAPGDLAQLTDAIFADIQST